MIDNVGEFCILNNDIVKADVVPKKININIGTVYEVIRVIDKIPLFLEDHLERMKNSLLTIGLNAEISLPVWKNNIYRLAEENNVQAFNTKIVCFEDKASNFCNTLAYVSKSYYPALSEVEAGMPVDLFKWERTDPNAKLQKDDYKTAVSNAIRDKNVFEVLLVNNENYISEGSRSNVFFLVNGKIYTAPGNVVLKGITRKYVFDACKNCGVEVIEEMLSIDELDKVDALFVSGTSIKVQPVSRIGKVEYSSGTNSIIIKIRKEFENIVNHYLNK